MFKILKSGRLEGPGEEVVVVLDDEGLEVVWVFGVREGEEELRFVYYYCFF